MADSIYHIAFTDPETGKVTRSKITSKRPLTETEKYQLQAAQAEKAGVDPSEVQIREQTAQKPIKTEVKEEPTGQAVARIAGQALPYAALGFINPPAAALRTVPAIGAWLASHPKLTGAALRTLAAPVVSGLRVGPLTGQEEYGKGAMESALWQAGAETVVPPVLKPFMRLGERAMRKFEERMASDLMRKIKQAIPWFKELPDSHHGIRAIAYSGEGPAKLMSNYGQAMMAVKNAIPEEARTTLSMADAQALKFAPTDMKVGPTPMLPREHTAEEAMALAKLTGAPLPDVLVPTRTLVDRVQGVWKTDPALSRRTIQALDAALPETESKVFHEARRLYREGMTMTDALRSLSPLDERTGRLNIERVVTAGRSLFGRAGEPGASILAEAGRAPETSRILRELIPSEGRAPHQMGFGQAHGFLSPITGHFGGSVGAEREALRGVTAITPPSPRFPTYSKDVPLTKGERKMLQMAPGVAHAAAKALGVAP